MLVRTHVVFAIFFILIFFQHVSNAWVFVIMTMIATIIPDLDSKFSSYGRHIIFRPLQFFVTHRGIIHSFTTACLLSILVAVFYPVASLGFFLGYGVHLLCDSFTKEGIQPFWPLKLKSSGPVTSGGRLDETLFITMIGVDILVFLVLVVF